MDKVKTKQKQKQKQRYPMAMVETWTKKGPSYKWKPFWGTPVAFNSAHPQSKEIVQKYEVVIRDQNKQTGAMEFTRAIAVRLMNYKEVKEQ